MDAEPLVFEQRGPIVVLTLNVPATRNALAGEAMFSAFEQAVARIESAADIRVAILTGSGSAFCSGGSVTDMKEKTGMFAGPPGQIAAQYRAGIQRIPLALARLEVPLIAAVNGPAIGAGCGLACMCDLRLASERATFAVSFIRLGIVPGDGSTWLLPRIIGPARTAELAFTGDTIDAPAALTLGLVSRVLPAERLMPETLALAERIAQNPPQALRWTKRLLRESQDASLATVLNLAAAHQAIAHHTADHAEAVAALFEKRRGNYSGR